MDLFLRCFLLTLYIDRYFCLLKPSHRAKSNNVNATKHIRHSLGRAATCQKPSNAHFDVHVAYVQYTSRTLFVNFRCSDSKDTKIVY